MRPSLAALMAAVVLCAEARAADEVVSLFPFEVEGVNGLSPEALAKRIEREAAEWRAPRPGMNDTDELGFLVLVRPALANSHSFCIHGTLSKAGPDRAIWGTAVIKRLEGDVLSEQAVQLTRVQAQEIYGWFAGSNFLDAAEPCDLPPMVYDGVELLIEITHENRTLRFRRNAYNNANAEKFYVQVQAMEVWLQPGRSDEPAGR